MPVSEVSRVGDIPRAEPDDGGRGPGGDAELVQLLTPEGERREHPDYTFDGTDEDVRGYYRDMVLSRRVDAEATALQRQGELGVWASSLGQEGAQVGSAHGMSPQDFVFPTYREHGVAWVRGVPPLRLLAMFRGVDHGAWDIEQSRFAPYAIIIGAQTLHATGYAMGVERDGLVGTGDPDAGHRRRRLLRRRRHQPGRRQRGLHLRQLLQRPGRLLLPEQPVGDLGAHRAAVPDPAVPPRLGLRLPRRPRRRQRRARGPGRHEGGAGARPLGQRTHPRRGLHLPDGRPHHLRRPDEVPAGRRAGALAAQGPDQPRAGVPDRRRAGRRRLLRPRRRRGRRDGRRAARRLPGPAGPGPHRDLRLGLRRADPLPGGPAGRARRVRRDLRGRAGDRPTAPGGAR